MLYIEFVGSEDRMQILRPFFERLKRIKESEATIHGIVEDPDAYVADSNWLDLLDDAAIEWLTDDEHWDLESIIECILIGEYDLVELNFSGGSGRLIYNPYAFPFGGTSSLKALVESFGLTVIRDELHDGFREWRRRRWWRFWEWIY